MSEGPLNRANERRPPWLRVKVCRTDAYGEVGALLAGLELNTVCREARCPNIWECWGRHRTATFMILGDICTRACRYCSVKKGSPNPVDRDEPEHVATAV
jgi:lipoic acid synthetase